jgi:type I restriction enzyme S subunit
MGSDPSWSISTLDNAAYFINGDRGKNYPSSSDYVASGIPFVSASDLDGRRIDLSGATFISQGAYDRLGNGKIEQGDILFCLRGSLGKIGLAKGIQKGAIASSLVIIRPKQDVSRDFLYYILSGSTGKTIARELDNGSVQGNLSVRELKQVEIDLPSPQEQKAIAHILGTLDDKIELNRKTNETLEAMAKALFKSWFVDFDPVRAKAEGRPTGLPAEISDLFPDSFEDSELGEIPSGWKCSPLADRAIYLSRGISPAYCEEGGVLVLNQKCVRDSRVSFEKARRHDTTRKQIIGREVRRFDALVNSTGVGTLGRVAMMPICQEEVVVDSHVTVVRGSNEQESFFISSTLLNRQTEIEALGEGSTGQTELSRVVLGSVPVIFPSPQLISAYFDFAFTIQDKIEKNDQASVVLASARDALLPKLISGEIRIPDAERMLEEVGV